MTVIYDEDEDRLDGCKDNGEDTPTHKKGSLVCNLGHESTQGI